MSYWERPLEEWLTELKSSRHGLTEEQARAAYTRFGPNQVGDVPWALWLRPLLKIVANPLVLILLAATVVSASLGQTVEAAIITTVVLISSVLDFVQSYRSAAAAESLRRSIRTHVTALRDEKAQDIPLEAIVPGDVVCLQAGSIIPGDGLLLDGRDMHLNEAALTGESMPVEKEPGTSSERSALRMGTSVLSGTGTMLIVATGRRTEFGRTAAQLTEGGQRTAFEKGISAFGRLVLWTVLALVLFVFVANLAFHRPLLEALLFSVALAVGLTPEFLPMIVSLSLSAAAVQLGRQRVIVRRLPAIENLGEMDILASDKTGTLTEGRIVLERHVDCFGNRDETVLKWAAVNSALESGLRSPMDDAILAHDHPAVEDYRKLDEVPYDFVRRRVSVFAEGPEGRLLICKGAPESVLAQCTHYRLGQQVLALDDVSRQHATETLNRFSMDGFRVLGVATGVGSSLEESLCLEGFCAFLDPPRADAEEVLSELRARGVRIKVLTGDNPLLTEKICRDVGLPADRMLTGAELERMNPEEFQACLDETVIFARVTPEQKQAIVAGLRRKGHVVGYMGDGVNDAPALRSADVGISVDSAVDVARETADILLLEKGLRPVLEGVLAGRRAFANITKYILMGTSSNFGNMLSMAIASLFLDFLPLLPAQVLLNTFLYDLAQLPLPLDTVEESSLIKPRHWDVATIRKSMLILGPLSSLYDLATFAVLLLVFHASHPLFRTGWFLESLITQVLVIFVIRTTRKPWQSRPSRALVHAVLLSLLAAMLLPYSPLAGPLGFVPLPGSFLAFVGAAALTYLTLVFWVKRLV